MNFSTRVRWQWMAMLLVMMTTLNGCAYFGMSGIQRAARNGNLELAESALLKGVNSNLRDRLGNTPLHFAAQRDIRNFIPTGGMSDLKSIWKIADSLDDVLVMNLLLDNGADINAVNKQGRTPLHMAALHNSPQMAFFLLSRGADASVKDKIGQTPMDLAMQHGYKDLREILEKQSDIFMLAPKRTLAPAPGQGAGASPGTTPAEPAPAH